VQNIGRCQVNGFQLGLAVGYFNLVTDIIILLLPVAVVSRLHIDLKRRRTLAVSLSVPFSAFFGPLLGVRLGPSTLWLIHSSSPLFFPTHPPRSSLIFPATHFYTFGALFSKVPRPWIKAFPTPPPLPLPPMPSTY
jgi:hypothetical protein